MRSNLLALLVFELDDVVVDLDGCDGSRKRLAPLAELPWTIPGTLPRCSARTTSTYRPLRSVITCSCRYFVVSLPRTNCSSVVAKPLALLAETVADAGQCRARLIQHLAATDRSHAELAATSCLKLAARPTTETRIGKAPVAWRTATLATSTESRKSATSRKRQRVEQLPFDGQHHQRVLDTGPARSGNSGLRLEIGRRLGRGVERVGHHRGSVCGWSSASACAPKRSQSQSGDHFDDAIEFESAERQRHSKRTGHRDSDTQRISCSASLCL